MRISKIIKVIWATIAVVIGVLTYSSLTTLEQRSKKFLPADLELSNGADGFPIKFVNLLSEPPAPDDSRKNVLFLMSDDLRVQLGTYDVYNPLRGVKTITPNLDRLANRSLVLERAYVQLSMCGPSRTSILTGRRPDTTRVWSQKEYWRRVGGNFTTLPQYFKENGYATANVGKVFHPRKASGKDDPISWTEPIYQPPDKKFWRTLADSWRAFTAAELAETPHPDQLIADEAIRKLRELAPAARRGRHFFLAVGFLKPHLPFVFPDRFLDAYPPDSVDLPPNPHVPQRYPELAYNVPAELLNRRDVAELDWSGDLNETLPADQTRKLRRAYFACVTFVDEKIGEILDALDQLGLADDTVVSFVGDHGWHLGENGRWGKHTNMEEGTRAPMMIAVPGRTDRGLRSSTVVEFVDLFPTVAEAAGLRAVPRCPPDSSTTELCTEGTSLLPLTDDPKARLKDAAYSQHKLYRKPGMGYSVRTDRFRYTEWIPIEATRTRNRTYRYELRWDRSYAAELYDHRIDPQENVNRADDRNYRGFRKELEKRLREKIGSVISNVATPL